MALRWRICGSRIQYLGLLLIVALLVGGCNRSKTPMPIAPTSTANSAPSTPTFETDGPLPQLPGSATGIASQGAIFTSPRYSYTVVLPCCWLALPTPGTAIESALAELETDGNVPLWGDLGERLRARENGAILELIALLPDEENPAMPVAQMTVSVLPTNGLTLDGYLAATEAELKSIANTQVLTSYIEPTLGVGAFPASIIEYTATPTPATPNSTEQTMAGLQVAFFGHGADTLIVLTFTTTTARYAQLQPEFLHIVRTVTLNDPTV